VGYLIYRNKYGPPGCRTSYKIILMKIFVRSQQVSKTLQVYFKCHLNPQEVCYCVYVQKLTSALCIVVQEGQSDGSESSPVGIVCRLPVGKPIIVVRFYAGRSIFSVSPQQTNCETQLASCPKDIGVVPREGKAVGKLSYKLTCIRCEGFE